MAESKVQEQRLDALLKAFRADSDTYKKIQIPEGAEEKQRLLRSLMNIRMPKKMADDILNLQNEYLAECGREKGIVRLSEIPITRGNLSIWQGDITRLQIDAVVNAANAKMLGCFIPMHTCIDNCIHTYAGIQLRQECHDQMERLREKYGRQYEQPTAVPMLTDAYNLPAKKVVHIVGPIVEFQLTEKLEEELAACYRNTLDLCVENGLRSVAFCCISTGVFRFPNRRAAQIAVDTVTKWSLEHPGTMERIIFNVFKDEDKTYYEELL